MKIGVIGNCTAPAIGLSLTQLLENDTIYGFEAIVWHRKGRLDEVTELMKSCDIVFLHKLPGLYGELEWSKFQALHPRAFALPHTPFTGFHPDCVYIQLKAGGTVGSPVGPYSSAIAAAAFSLGGDVEAAARLFNAEVFEKLGYFAEFEKAKSFMLKTFAQFGLDAASEWESWMRQAPFMHTINHPRPVVVAGIAKMMAAKAELIGSHVKAPIPIHDSLSNSAIWPVYPEIGAALGLPGGYLFKKGGASYDISDGQGPFLRLQPFLEQSFAIFEKHDKAVFDVPPVTRVATAIKDAL
jgi:hypothetical protein